MMWSIGMADRDNSQDSREAGVSGGQVNPQTDDPDVLESTEGAGPTNEDAENAIRALGNREGEQNAQNGAQGGVEEEESKELILLLNPQETNYCKNVAFKPYSSRGCKLKGLFGGFLDTVR